MIARGLAILSLLLLGAHYLRYGDPGGGVFLGGLAMLALSPRAWPWVRWAALGVLGFGVAAWTRTGVDLVVMRHALGEPWQRLALIMAAVLLFTLISMLLLVLHKDSGRRTEHPRALGAIFLLTCGALFLARMKVPFPILLADRFWPGWGGVEVLGLGCYAAWLGSHMLPKKGARRMRPRIWALFSLIFFLQLGLGLLGLEQFLMTGRLHLPVPALIVAGPLFRGSGFFMLILFSVTMLLVGPAWCSHLCYIGAWDDRCVRLGGKRPVFGYPAQKHWGRGLSLLVVVVMAFALRLAGVPGLTATWLAAGFGLLGVGVMVFKSSRAGVMAHCTTYCPMGLVANVLGRISPWRIRMGKGCTDCLTCTKFCRYGALQPKDVRNRRPGLTCTLCGDCVSVCPHGAAGYTFPGLSTDAARTSFLVLVISLHALFLGVARI